ncbi:MAG: hypothetical protein M3Q60_00030 [Actinomycetota bacterium]|nr:hypothetical protein [Actinomycetota bacterium]
MGGVGRRALERRLAHLEALMPPRPPEYQELPLERWVDEIMSVSGPDLYGEEEDFYRWLEGFGLYVRLGLNARIAEARHEPPAPLGTVPPLPPVLEERCLEALVPHVERWRRIFAEAAPQREAKRRMAEEWDDSRGGRYGKGREWLREYDRERAELRKRYEGWEQRWERDYAEWRRVREMGKPAAVRSE